MSEFNGDPFLTVKMKYDEDEEVEVKYEPLDSELESNDVRDPVPSPQTISSEINSGIGIHESDILRYDNACLTCREVIIKITAHLTGNLCPIVNETEQPEPQSEPQDDFVKLEPRDCDNNDPKKPGTHGSVNSGQKQYKVLEFDTGFCTLGCKFCEKCVQELKNHLERNHPQLQCQPTYDSEIIDLVTDSNASSTERSTVFRPLKTIDFASAEAYRFQLFQHFRKPIGEKNTRGTKDTEIKKRTTQTSKRAGYSAEMDRSGQELDQIPHPGDKQAVIFRAGGRYGKIADKMSHTQEYPTNLDQIMSEPGNTVDAVEEHPKLTKPRTTTQILKKPFECSECEESFMTMNTLTLHEKIHMVRNSLLDENGDKDVVTHTVGNWTEYNAESKIDNRPRKDVKVRLPRKEKRFKCESCGDIFLNEQNLTRHKLEMCGKDFSHQTATSLITHKKLTRKWKNGYKCDVCEKSFSTPSHVTCHERTHTGQNLLKCETCGKYLAEMRNLRQHKKLHTGERPYKCEICGKSFVEAGVLTKHKRWHTRGKS